MPCPSSLVLQALMNVSIPVNSVMYNLFECHVIIQTPTEDLLSSFLQPPSTIHKTTQKLRRQVQMLSADCLHHIMQCQTVPVVKSTAWSNHIIPGRMRMHQKIHIHTLCKRVIFLLWLHQQHHPNLSSSVHFLVCDNDGVGIRSNPQSGNESPHWITSGSFY